MVRIQKFVILMFAGVLTAACATTEGTRPDDMSHQEHLAAAEREKNDAQHNLDAAVEFGLLGSQSSMREALWEQHQKHAKEHRSAADALINFHAEVCSSAPEDAGHCPLMAHEANIQKVERLSDGIAALYPSDFPKSGEDVGNQARCHYAQGRMLGREGMPGCPFFNKDLTISVEESTDGSFKLVVRTENEKSLTNLHSWASNVGPESSGSCGH